VGTVGLGCLAKSGHKIIGVDLNPTKVQFINAGKSPIVENQIDEIIHEQYNKKNISATTDVISAVIGSDVSFICVGTPSTPQGHLNLDGIYRVAKDIALGIKQKQSFHVVAIRSTVLPGTNEKVVEIIREHSGKTPGVGFGVVSNPEFLREGTAVKDFFGPPFTLIGSLSEKALDIMKEVYGGINSPLVVTDVRIAEIIKYVNNSFHALKITFTNEVGNICKKVGVDSHELMRIFCMDTKLNISPAYFKPGFAFGGSCLPKDLKGLRTIAHDLYLHCPIIENIEISNELQKEIVLNQIIAFGKQKIGFLGLSFKEGTDDLRSSPVVDVLEKLLGKGFAVKIFDRNVRLSQLVGANKDFILQKIPFISRFLTDQIMEVIDDSEVIVVVNKENGFKEILEDNCRTKIVYDLININLTKDKIMPGYVGVAW